MNGKIGLTVGLLALAALVASESQSFGGCHRRGRCGGCYSACTTGCGAGACETAPAAPADASPSDAPPAAPQGAAKSPAPASPQAAPSVTSKQPGGPYYYTSRRARRGWRR